MLTIQTKQVVISTFMRKEMKADDNHPFSTSIVMSLSPEQFRMMINQILTECRALKPEMINFVSNYCEKWGQTEPSIHTGSYDVECWEDDNQIDRLVLNQIPYPEFGKEPARFVVLSDMLCSITVRIMIKKDKTTILIIRPLSIFNDPNPSEPQLLIGSVTNQLIEDGKVDTKQPDKEKK